MDRIWDNFLVRKLFFNDSTSKFSVLKSLKCGKLPNLHCSGVQRAYREVSSVWVNTDRRWFLLSKHRFWANNFVSLWVCSSLWEWDLHLSLVTLYLLFTSGFSGVTFKEYAFLQSILFPYLQSSFKFQF